MNDATREKLTKITKSIIDFRSKLVESRVSSFMLAAFLDALVGDIQCHMNEAAKAPRLPVEPLDEASLNRMIGELRAELERKSNDLALARQQADRIAKRYEEVAADRAKLVKQVEELQAERAVPNPGDYTDASGPAPVGPGEFPAETADAIALFSIDFMPNESGSLDTAFPDLPPWLEVTHRSNEIIVRRFK